MGPVLLCLPVLAVAASRDVLLLDQPWKACCGTHMVDSTNAYRHHLTIVCTAAAERLLRVADHVPVLAHLDLQDPHGEPRPRDASLSAAPTGHAHTSVLVHLLVPVGVLCCANSSTRKQRVALNTCCPPVARLRHHAAVPARHHMFHQGHIFSQVVYHNASALSV